MGSMTAVGLELFLGGVNYPVVSVSILLDARSEQLVRDALKESVDPYESLLNRAWEGVEIQIAEKCIIVLQVSPIVWVGTLKMNMTSLELVVAIHLRFPVR